MILLLEFDLQNDINVERASHALFEHGYILINRNVWSVV